MELGAIQAADEEKTVPEIVERLVKSLEAQTIQVYVKIYEKRLLRRKRRSSSSSANTALAAADDEDDSFNDSLPLLDEEDALNESTESIPPLNVSLENIALMGESADSAASLDESTESATAPDEVVLEEDSATTGELVDSATTGELAEEETTEAAAKAMETVVEGNTEGAEGAALTGSAEAKGMH